MNRALKAWFWMLDYAYTVTDELRAALEHPAPFESAAGAGAAERSAAVGERVAAADDGSASTTTPNPVGRPVLLLPGVFETWVNLRAVGDEVRRLGHPVHVVPGLGRNVVGIDASARRIEEYLARNDLVGVVIVAHSKGGLVGKYLMLRLDPEHRIDGMVAINAPFSGSQWGDYLPLPSLRALARDDLIVRFLGGPSEVNGRIVSVYSTFDQNVRAGSRLAGARNVRLNVAGHSRILGSKKLLRVLPEFFSWLPPRR
ncbi:MAG: alpha/beta hydrolase [Subtercola sp.]|nr:alpha/beta hydrolase [Subtercola sp.]